MFTKFQCIGNTVNSSYGIPTNDYFNGLFFAGVVKQIQNSVIPAVENLPPNISPRNF